MTSGISLRIMAGGVMRHAIPLRWRWALRRARHFGRARECPICGSRLQAFQPYGRSPRPEARCPVCHSLERHRLLWLYLKRRTPLFEAGPRRFLHVAAERELARQFARIPDLTYIRADLSNPGVHVYMDLQRMPFPGDCFDVVLCSHVLEHVPDDRAAAREIARVLHPDGWAVIQVPVELALTIEDPALRDPRERLRRFGHPGHLRRYGRDFLRRLEGCGLQAREVRAVDLLSSAEATRFGVSHEEIFHCIKRGS